MATNALDGTYMPEFCLAANTFSIMCYHVSVVGEVKLTGPKKQLGHQQGGSPFTLRSYTPREEEMGTVQKLRTASKSATMAANDTKPTVWVHCTDNQA